MVNTTKLSPLAVWALAAGGMVGGGIYTVLGVVIAVAGEWSWLSFLVIGILATTSAYSYVFLANTFNKKGGAFAFLEKVKDKNMAGNISWLLILGYVFTISVYAFAFGHYVAFAFHGNTWIIRLLAVFIVMALILLNLAGVGKLTKVEITIVSVNLLALLLLSLYGLSNWDTTQLVSGIEPKPIWSSLIGGAAIFMAYEGFQLLTYEYDRIKNAQKNFMPVLISAVIFVVVLYITVSLGATMLGGAIVMIDYKEIALSIAAGNALGQTGVILMTIAAGFATAAAINSTLFSTANLSKNIASKGELPKWFNKTNKNDVPGRSIVFLGSLAGVLAIIGSLSALVEGASLIFLCTFGTVNWIAYRESKSKRWVPILGLVLAILIAAVLIFRLVISKPVIFGAMMVVIILIVLGRPMLLNYRK
ncbi:MAG TPA: amino acid permease [Leeuwenhoekiella sp.]|nr:amino acid permease [Leeuwenhoekiella sp.]